ncbi:2'-5' RNA ligase family protein [Streptomyces sp. HC307]|uniref:2'-5' RNA ligase family protein n=1 Tax=Streptomyces flavusporus TaxID=3385496 RepID=UPI0039170D48
MADDDSHGFQAGQSGLVVRVPEAEPAVRAWRDRLDPSARAGVPAHVTVLFPFLDASRIDPGVCAAIGEVLGRHQSFEARFEHCGRFPGVLYLAPEPDGPFRCLTEAIVERWPESPPSGGQFDGVVPHLTVAQGQARLSWTRPRPSCSAVFPSSRRSRRSTCWSTTERGGGRGPLSRCDRPA